MEIQVLKSKLHCVTVTQAELDYIGSITIDEDLMDAANDVFMYYEQNSTLNNFSGKNMNMVADTFYFHHQTMARWETLNSILQTKVNRRLEFYK